MSIYEGFDEIWSYSHFWNWSPDWLVVKEIYEKIPSSYSVLMPFAYSYNVLFTKSAIPRGLFLTNTSRR